MRTMKEPLPDRQNQRIIQLAGQFLLLPFKLVAMIFRLPGRLRQSMKSEKVVQEEDALRQSRARRELRGLPPDHVQAAHGKGE